jgi:protein-tyrosine phosphatase
MRIEFDDQAAGIAPQRYLQIPVVDDDAPSLAQLNQGIEFIAREVAQDGAVYVHCGSGVGRAATMAAAYLISTGLSVDEAWQRIRQVRPFIRPTAIQVELIEQFGAQG